MNEKLMKLSLEEKESLSKNIIKEAYEKYKDKVGIAYSGGKDSTTLLHLVKEVFDGNIPWPVFWIDTGLDFEEILKFIETIQTEWNINIISIRNVQLPTNFHPAINKVECCYLLKTIPINNTIEQYKLKAFMTGIRWDEQETRTNEEFFSLRKQPEHFRVHPILHFREIDIWQYIKKYNILYCELYKKGYRSIDCKPCTKPYMTGDSERGGRDPKKEEVMRRLREMGYF